MYLHFDPAVHRLEDLSVVDGMDLNQQGQTLGYYGRKRKESEKTEMLPKRRAQARPLLGLRRSSDLVFCVKLMAETRRKDGR